MESTTAKTEWRLRLYVRDNGPLSVAAIENLQSLIHQHLKDRCHLEIIDISRNLQRAAEDDIVAVPTLLRLSPGPVRRLVGDFTRTDRVLMGLEISTGKSGS